MEKRDEEKEMRWRRQLRNALEKDGYRTVSKDTGIAVSSLHEYTDPTAKRRKEPRFAALEAMADSFNEPMFLLVSDLDDDTANLIQYILRLEPDERQDLLDQIRRKVRSKAKAAAATTAGQKLRHAAF